MSRECLRCDGEVRYVFIPTIVIIRIIRIVIILLLPLPSLWIARSEAPGLLGL